MQERGSAKQPAMAAMALEGRNSGNNQGQSTQNENSIYSKNRLFVYIFVFAVKILMFFLVFATLVASKVSLTTMLAHLRSMTEFGDVETAAITTNKTATKAQKKSAAGLYWQLLFILMIPNIITWGRALFNGIIGKSTSQPWPTLKALAGGIVLAAVEAVSETALLFYGWILLPPEISLLLMNGLFSIQAILNFKNFWKYCGFTAAYENIENPYPWIPSPPKTWCSFLVATSFIIGFLMQFGGLVSVSVLISWNGTESWSGVTYTPKINWAFGTLVIAVCTLLLSIAWSDGIQRLVTVPFLGTLSERFRNYAEKHNYEPTARWTSNFLSTSVRLIIYPFASYAIFRYTYRLKNDTGSIVDPWCLNNYSLSIHEVFQWEKHEIEMFTIHTVCSFLVYIFSWLACFMSLHKYGLILPVLLATPTSLGILVTMSNLNAKVGFPMDGLFMLNSSGIYVDLVQKDQDQNYVILAFSLAALLWVGQITVTTYKLWKSRNTILATDEDMFVRPYYNSILLEQYLILNRDVITRNNKIERGGSRVFICSTMYREKTKEMKQMLQSLRRVAKHHKFERNSAANRHELERITKFESHIFFDGGCKDTEILPFAVQLFSLIQETLGVEFDQVAKKETPYGCRLECEIEPDDDKTRGMPFVVHLKDNQKVKNKKRWSQVMYMNYVINYRAENDRPKLDLDNTFILTTDADIDFKAESAIVLLDMLARDFHVGAVSSRTHPKGSGVFYWYQVFDYAIGHWLQKPAEHLLGCVLCCPGCFSLFRCSALKDCLETYSSEVTDANDFLTKDMGEDRWLCTLLVENGWRLDYCAISNDETFCPEDFDEFFKQRRRWIPSTFANLWLLISSVTKITRQNTSINVLFIIYQVFILLSTIISPATVLMIISASLAKAFSIDHVAVIIPLLIISVMYGLACVYTSQRTQLDLAKLLTMFFSILMVVVVAAIVTSAVRDVEILFFPKEEFITPELKKVLDYYQHNPNCTNCKDFLTLFSASNGTAGPEEASVEGLPIAASTLYTGLYALSFTVTAILHYQEFFCLVQIIWYLLGLPGGYLILLIYSAANLNSRSWGTREVKSDKEEDIFTIIYSGLKMAFNFCFRRTQLHKPSQDNEKEEKSSEQEPEELDLQIALEPPETTHQWLHDWLEGQHCTQFYNNFVKAGYTTKCCVAEMNREDLEMIGIKSDGFVRHLDTGIKELFASPINSGIPDSIEDWITKLEMDKAEENYVQKFRAAGYITPKDVEHLREVTENELINIGVTKIAHRRRFMQAIKMLKKESKDEKLMRMAKAILKKRQPELLESELERKFWTSLIENTLAPVSEKLTEAAELKNALENLRNSTLISMLLINLIWIVLFLTLTFQDLKRININPEVLIILFLAVYGVILIIQFIAMLIHRLITISQYIARLNEKLPVEYEEEPELDGQNMAENHV